MLKPLQKPKFQLRRALVQLPLLALMSEVKTLINIISPAAPMPKGLSQKIKFVFPPKLTPKPKDICPIKAVSNKINFVII